jgi:hypothetical protein
MYLRLGDDFWQSRAIIVLLGNFGTGIKLYIRQYTSRRRVDSHFLAFVMQKSAEILPLTPAYSDIRLNTLASLVC